MGCAVCCGFARLPRLSAGCGRPSPDVELVDALTGTKAARKLDLSVCADGRDLVQIAIRAGDNVASAGLETLKRRLRPPCMKYLDPRVEHAPVDKVRSRHVPALS